MSEKALDLPIALLNAQWYDRDYWTNVQQSVDRIDRMIDEFNAEVGILS